jgi:hypothetical protein
MKIYSLFTKQHKVFKDEWFLPSLKDDFEVIIKEYSIEEEGEIGNLAFKNAMFLKVSTIIDAISDNINDVIIYSDIDIQFFKPIQNPIHRLIDNFDLLIQRDSPFGVFCAGFMVIRCNKKTLSLFKSIRKRMEEKDTHDDQQILNEILHYDIIESNYFKRVRIAIVRRWGILLSKLKISKNINYKLFTSLKNDYGVKCSHLPETFLSGGTLTGKLWNPGDELEIPKGILLHHANWTVGLKNKILQLKYVREAVKSSS